MSNHIFGRTNFELGKILVSLI